MILHTATVAPEKLTSHQPAAVHFCGVSKGIDMEKTKRFIVGDCGEVRTEEFAGGVMISFIDYMVDLGGKAISEIPSIEGIGVVDVGPLSPEQAYLLGKSLLMAAKINGVSE